MIRMKNQSELYQNLRVLLNSESIDTLYSDKELYEKLKQAGEVNISYKTFQQYRMECGIPGMYYRRKQYIKEMLGKNVK